MGITDGEVGRSLALFRGDRSQKELGERMAERGWKWSQSTVWSVESGKRPLRYGEAVDLCGILGISLDQLSGEPHSSEQVSAVAMSTLMQIDELLASAKASIGAIYDTPRNGSPG